MDHFAGIDVSLEQSNVCVVDATGWILREAKVASPIVNRAEIPGNLPRRRRCPGRTPDTITMDKHAGYPPALAQVFGDSVEHRTSKYKNSRLPVPLQRPPFLPGL